MDEKIVQGIVRNLEGTMQLPLVKATIKVVGENKAEVPEFRVHEEDVVRSGAKILFAGEVSHKHSTTEEEAVSEKGLDKSESTSVVHQKIVKPAIVEKKGSLPTPSVHNLLKSISKISNMIEGYLHQEDMYNICLPYLKGKMYADEFYRKVQNSIYKTLRNYCQITVDENNNPILPKVDDIQSDEVLSTLVFFDRIYNDRSVSFEKDVYKVMPNYRKHFTDGTDGISSEWLSLLKSRLEVKFNMGSVGVLGLTDVILSMWVNDIDLHRYNKSAVADFTNDESVDAEDESDDDVSNGISIYIASGTIDEHDVIKIHSYDADGLNITPFYTNLGDVDVKDHSSTNVWNFLRMFTPSMIVSTETPDKYLTINQLPLSDCNLRCAILKEEDGHTHIGIYLIDGVYQYDIGDEPEKIEDGELDGFIEIVNSVVEQSGAIDNETMSHITYSLEDELLYQEEGKFFSIFHSHHNDDSDAEEENVDEKDESVDEDEPEEDLTDVALREVMGTSEEESEEEVDEESSEDYSDDNYDEEEEDSIARIGVDPDDDDNFTFTPVRRKH